MVLHWDYLEGTCGCGRQYAIKVGEDIWNCCCPTENNPLQDGKPTKAEKPNINGFYTDDQLIYAAYARCECGAGLAYPEDADPFKGYWDCSDILTGRAIPKDEPGAVKHSGRYPFIFYEIKSEKQPSANGATTRPK